MLDNITGSSSLISINGTSVLSWTYVNFAQPKWIYIITFYIPGSGLLNNYVDTAVNGTGISPQTFEAAYNLILGQEAKYTACFCEGLH